MENAIFAVLSTFPSQLVKTITCNRGAEFANWPQLKNDSILPLLRKQLADTNRGIENMLNAIQQGILTSSTKERLEELEKLREELKTSILQAELEQPKYSREDIVEWLSRFK